MYWRATMRSPQSLHQTEQHQCSQPLFAERCSSPLTIPVACSGPALTVHVFLMLNAVTYNSILHFTGFKTKINFASNNTYCDQNKYQEFMHCSHSVGYSEYLGSLFFKKFHEKICKFLQKKKYYSEPIQTALCFCKILKPFVLLHFIPLII